MVQWAIVGRGGQEKGWLKGLRTCISKMVFFDSCFCSRRRRASFFFLVGPVHRTPGPLRSFRGAGQLDTAKKRALGSIATLVPLFRSCRCWCWRWWCWRWCCCCWCCCCCCWCVSGEQWPAGPDETTAERWGEDVSRSGAAAAALTFRHRRVWAARRANFFFARTDDESPTGPPALIKSMSWHALSSCFVRNWPLQDRVVAPSMASTRPPNWERSKVALRTKNCSRNRIFHHYYLALLASIWLVTNYSYQLLNQQIGSSPSLRFDPLAISFVFSLVAIIFFVQL